ncbi:putative DNA-3-methyladenine glycosylase II [Helianthus annuus]|nr:putative DNA-3-methyladenine glycosylase II [Helianthus annuus]
MKITKRFNRVIKPLKPINTSTSDSKPHTIKPKPNLNPKPRTLKQSNLYPKPTFILEKAPILGPDFYQIDALDLAPKLLGKYLKRDDVVLQITEVVEAYRYNDSACHGRVGVTPRTAPLIVLWAYWYCGISAPLAVCAYNVYTRLVPRLLHGLNNLNHIV